MVLQIGKGCNLNLWVIFMLHCLGRSLAIVMSSLLLRHSTLSLVELPDIFLLFQLLSNKISRLSGTICR